MTVALDLKRFVIFKTREERFTSNVDTCKRKLYVREKSITNCNGNRACGDQNFMAAVCMKVSCPPLADQRRPNYNTTPRVSLVLSQRNDSHYIICVSFIPKLSLYRL